MKNRMLVTLWIAGLVVLGCSPGQIFGDIVDDTTQQIGEDIADRVVSSYLSDIGPAMIRSYTLSLVQVMFYQGGVYGADMAYEPGEYSVWSSADSPYGQTIERAFLQRRDDGWEWWRIEIFGEDPDTDDEVHMIMEALFEPREDERYIRELYVQYPDDPAPQQVEIREEDADEWVIQAEELSDEAFEEFLVGTEDITVPAGTFSAEKYAIEAEEHDDILTEWWMAGRQVPGSLVKILQTDEDTGDTVHTMQLESYGDDAESSVLGAF